MYDDPVQFIVEISFKLFRITFYCVDTYKYISSDNIIFGIIECDYIRKIIVLEVLFVDFEYLIVRAEYIGDVACFLLIRCSDFFNPFIGDPFF